MEWFPESKDHLPLTWWKQTPVYLAAVLALGGVASMVLTALLMAVDPSLLGWLVFTVNNAVVRWRVWTPLTYVLVNQPSLWFLLSSYLLYNFGEALERHLGRWSFVKLILWLVLVTPVLLGVVGIGGPRDWPAVGLGTLEFGVFIAFAALYPSAQISLILFTLEAWVLATAVVAVNALQYLAAHDWPGLFVFAGEVLTAFGYIRHEQGRFHLPAIKLRQAPPAAPVLAAQTRRPSGKRLALPEGERDDNVDAILDKIHLHGISSLTDQEKRALERASERLGRKDQ